MRFLILCCFLGVLSGLAQAVEVSGSYTQLLFQHQNTLKQQVNSNISRMRVNLEDAGKSWQWKLSYDHELLYGGMVRDPLFQLRRRIPDPTWLDLNANIKQTAALNWQHNLYRAWFKYHHKDWSLRIGRQRIAWGVGRIWNPTDRFNPVQATALEPDQKLGVDAAYLRYAYDDFASFQGVLAPGKAAHGLHRKWALRWQNTINETDVSGWLGQVGQERVFAMDMTTNLADWAMRFEWQQSWHGQQGDYGQFIVGLDGNDVSLLFPEGLYVAAEYFYNGLPQRTFVRGIQLDKLHSSSRQLLGLLAGYDLSPLWRADLSFLLDLEQTSMFIAPSLRWSATENLDAFLFAQLPSSKTGGAFFDLKPVLGVKLEAYF